ncbi:MAG: outer rane transport energization protein TonB [Proteobacteria bacterium]|nr:outer rane transport energization protein TonB [Pseudomonadota bacterium]
MTPGVLVEVPSVPMISRKFWAILGLSVLFHAALFALTSWQRQHGPVALPAIIASIRLNPVAESGPVAAASAPASVPQKARQNPQPTEQRTPPRVTQPAGPANVPAQTASPSMASSGESVAPVAAAAPVAEAARPAPAAAQARPQSEILDHYRQRLGELFARHQEYPRIAAMRGWEGEVRLRLKVARRGNLLGVALDRSSGFEVLDQHALAMLEALAGLPPLPEALDSNEIQVVVPINYKLKKTT